MFPNIKFFFFLIGYNINETVPSVKLDVFMRSILICPICQAIFSPVSMSKEQLNQHINAHTQS